MNNIFIAAGMPANEQFWQWVDTAEQRVRLALRKHRLELADRAWLRHKLERARLAEANLYRSGLALHAH